MEKSRKTYQNNETCNVDFLLATDVNNNIFLNTPNVLKKKKSSLNSVHNTFFAVVMALTNHRAAIFTFIPKVKKIKNNLKSTNNIPEKASIFLILYISSPCFTSISENLRVLIEI